MSGSQDVPGRGHTISLNDSEPGTSYLPLDSPPQYMPDSPPEYSVLPGGTGMIDHSSFIVVMKYTCSMQLELYSVFLSHLRSISLIVS